MPRHPIPALQPEPDPEPVPDELDEPEQVDLTGEVRSPVELVAQPQFTPEMISEDGRNRVSRTASQAIGGGSGTVLLLNYLFERYLKAHQPPVEVLIVLVGLVATAWSRWSNRKRISGHLG